MKQFKALSFKLHAEMTHARDIASWSIEAGNYAKAYRVNATRKNNWNCRGSRSGRQCRWRTTRDITATCRCTNSVANVGSLSYTPSAQRYSIAKSLGSLRPISFKPSWKATSRFADEDSDWPLR